STSYSSWTGCPDESRWTGWPTNARGSSRADGTGRTGHIAADTTATDLTRLAAHSITGHNGVVGNALAVAEDHATRTSRGGCLRLRGFSQADPSTKCRSNGDAQQRQ